MFDSVDDEDKDIVMINDMMNMLYSNGDNESCLKLFDKLANGQYGSDDTLRANIIFLVNAFIACMLETGIRIHEKLNMDMNKWMLSDVSIQVNLIKLYNKCGKLDICKQIFFELRNDNRDRQNIASWTAMIQAYRDNAKIKQAKLLYDNLREHETLKADENTFGIMINICAHNDALEDTIAIWENDIIVIINIKFDNQVISCLVDVYSRIGDLDKAHELIPLQHTYCVQILSILFLIQSTLGLDI